MPIYARVRGDVDVTVYTSLVITTSYFHLTINEMFACVNIRVTLVASFSEHADY